MQNFFSYFILLLFFSINPGFAQTKNKIIAVETGNTALIYAVDTKGQLIFKNYGAKMTDNSVYQLLQRYPKADTDRDLSYEAYPTFGKGNINEPALSLINSDGSLITELAFVEENVIPNNDANIKHTIIVLKDKVYDLLVELHTEAYQKEDVIAQWTVITNNESDNVVLKNMYSSFLNLTANEYYLTHFTGCWAGEMDRIEEKLLPGIKTIESKKGIRTTQTENASFILALNHPAQENYGVCYGGALAWSGNYKINFQIDEWKYLSILSGVNPFMSDIALDKGESFITPKMIYSFSKEGQGLISRNFHDWSRKYALNNGNRQRPIVLNSWEGAYFDFDEKVITDMIDDAASMGVEMFVLDDGWFGNKYPRNNAVVGLGDWQVNKKKLPQGIQHLINHAHSKDVKFGIWIEPEMISPKSELAEKHSDWIVQSYGREKITWRNQLLLDLTNPEVQDFIWNMIDDLLSKNKGIDYIKWDANRHVEQVGSKYLSADKQTHFWIEYTKGLYSVYDRIRAKYPDLMLQACSAGGGRIDYGSLKYHDEFWTSDNTDPLKRLYIQYSTNLLYPPVATGAHISTSPNHQTGRMTPLKFRVDVAMTGRLGLELQPKDMQPEEMPFVKQALSDYKAHIRPLITYGDLYRILSPYDKETNYASQMYVAKDKSKAILYAFSTDHHSRGLQPLLKLQGLDRYKNYRITEINQIENNSSFWGNEQVFKGEFLMDIGIEVNINRQYDSGVFLLEEMKH